MIIKERSVRKNVKKTSDILIIMPAFNEAENIGAFLDKIKEAGVPEKADILVINDGSLDQTSSIVKKKGMGIVTHIYNLGYGCALQTGYKYAVRNDYDYVVQIDSDGQHDVVNIMNIINELKFSDDKPDIVIGSRFMENSGVYKMSSVRKIAIKLFRFMIRRSTKRSVQDPTSGLQGLNRKAFIFYSYYNNFVHDYPDANMIIQMLMNDYKIKEVPAIMHPRLTGQSMHSGLMKPFLYMLKMFMITSIVIIREKYFSKKSSGSLKVSKEGSL